VGHRDAEEEGEISKVGHRELAMELVGEMTKKVAAGGGEDDVVHVEQEISHLITPAKNKQRDIAFGSNEPDVMHIVGEALVPRPRGLLEAIEGLVKPTNMLRMSVIDEAGRLLAVHLLVKSKVGNGQGRAIQYPYPYS
jgi:hypothetical protein